MDPATAAAGRLGSIYFRWWSRPFLLLLLLAATGCSDYLSPQAATFIQQCKQGLTVSLLRYNKHPGTTKKVTEILRETCICLGQEIDRSGKLSAKDKQQFYADGSRISVERPLPDYRQTRQICEVVQAGVLIRLAKISDDNVSRVLPSIRWYLGWDSDGNGSVGASDILNIAIWVFLVPGDFFLDVFPSSALEFIGLGEEDYGGVLAWILSLIAWGLLITAVKMDA